MKITKNEFFNKLDKISLLDNVNEGENVIVSCNVYSREYNGRFFHNIDGWKISSSATGSGFVTTDDTPF